MPLVLEIVQSVAKHNITVQQLKKVFRLLHIQGECRARYANQIMRMLNSLYSVMDVRKPDQSYLLVPPASGLQIVTEMARVVQAGQAGQAGQTVHVVQTEGIPRFPQTGYTLSLWFNLSSLMADWIMEGGTRDVGSLSVEFAIPHLFSFVEGETAFLVYIQNAALVIKLYQNGKEVPLPDTNLPILDNHWYHLVVSQSYNRLQKTHPLFVSLNGQTNFECSAPYPAFAHSVRMFVGTRGVDLPFTSIPTAYTEFSGELGTVYMLNKAVTKTQAHGMFLLGPNYMFNFENYATESRPIFDNTNFQPADRQAIQEVCNGSLPGCLLINLSACVMNREKTCVLDDTPARPRAQKWASGAAKEAEGAVRAVNGLLLCGTHVCSTKQIASVVDSLGGIALFFPLLPQMDLAEFGGQPGDARMNEEFTSELYELLSNAIKGSDASRDFMEKQNGFDVIAYLMQKANPKDVSVAFLEKVTQLLEDSSLSQEAHHQIFKAFFMNAPFWVYCDAAVQKQVYNTILQVLQTNENKDLVAVIKSIGLEGFCHILRYFYCSSVVSVPEEVGVVRAPDA